MQKEEVVSDPYYRYDPYYNTYNDMAVKESIQKADPVEYTDKEQIQQILDNIISDKFNWQINGYADLLDSQYSIEIRFKKNNPNVYNCYRFIKGQVPAFI